jgi:uncharacterized protein YjaZ
MRNLALFRILCLSALLSACESSHLQLEFYEIDGRGLSWWERILVTLIAEAAEREARPRLPQLPQQLLLRVQPGKSFEVDERTGDNTAVLGPDTIMWTVDPSHAGGITAAALHELHASLFHEWHHMVRDAALAQTDMLDRAVREGLALAFERDCAHSWNPRGLYRDEAALWVEELREAPKDLTVDEWYERNAHGRRWVVARAGTYLVDRALRASGKSAAELATTPTAAILSWARAH